MIALRSKFDGQKIEVPEELKRSEPVEVMIVYSPRPSGKTDGVPVRHSIWDVVGEYKGTRTAEEIIASVRAERDEWDDR